MATVLASLNRLEELSVHDSNQDDSNSNTNSNSNSKSKLESSISDSNQTGSNTQSIEADIIAKRAGKTVLYLKFSVVLILMIAGAIVASAIYLSTKNGQKDALAQAYDGDATKVFDTVKFNIEQKLSAIDKLSLDMASLSADVGAKFPTFTMPDFEYRASSVGAIADAPVILYAPIVMEETRAEWEAYALDDYSWIIDGLQFYNSLQVDTSERKLQEISFATGFANHIFYSSDGEAVEQNTGGPYLPVWTHYPPVSFVTNYDVLTAADFRDDLLAVLESQEAVIGKIGDLFIEDNTGDSVFQVWVAEDGLEAEDLVSKFYYPVFDGLDENQTMVGVIIALINWHTYFAQILPPGANGVVIVLTSECDSDYTYIIEGEVARLLGRGDLHNPKFNDMRRENTFTNLLEPKEGDIKRFTQVNVNSGYCPFTMTIYPTEDLYNEFITDAPLLYLFAVIAMFALTIVLFLAYDFIIEARQQRAMKRAIQSRAIVSSLFPAAVRERLFKADDSDANRNAMKDKVFRRDHAKNKLRNFLSDAITKDSKPAIEAKPIADLFPHTTVMFSDIAGFTKWSSERDPTHVFTLLQTVYHTFDRIAKRRNVFKVETIGDCYVAVTGLPDPQPDHAVRMAKFASECREKFGDVIEALKESLGEDTANLGMRFGLHSGPVTAGVLRGEKSRFQLFGNTVNNAAKMESSGERNKIQISAETADLITEAGKGHWVFLRIDDIATRGGMQTYWVEPQSSAQEAKHNHSMPTRTVAKTGANDIARRLIDWNTDLLKKLLKQIVAHRKDKGLKSSRVRSFTIDRTEGGTIRDELVQSIDLPKFDKNSVETKISSIELGKEVDEQLRKFVSLIASLYHDTAFHNFQHASNVCTNANKMMNSITDQEVYQRTSHPLAQFAVAFSALIHDVDHTGVPNSILMKEKPRMAVIYKNKSCAEQNSVDLSWNLLMDPEFELLQDTIFQSEEEFIRFRQIVVNSVLATDIFDHDLNKERERRFQLAFGKGTEGNELSPEERGNLKATVSLEYAMQIADIMHTTQHFNSYCRWNERLYEEMYRAYESGRSKTNPSTDWYAGEIWFFDACVIPISMKIKNSGVFGHQGEDCFRNAIENKKDWTVKGADIVSTLVAKKASLATKEVSVTRSEAVMTVDPTENTTKEMKDEKKKPTSLDASNKKLLADADRHMVEWNVDLFKRLLRQILAHRMGSGHDSKEGLVDLASSLKEGSTVRDELSRIVAFPFFDKEASRLKVDPDTIVLSDSVQQQLRDYVHLIATLYNENAFHNFKHASNVATSANKYLQRITDHTLSMQMFDPMTQFAIIFSSLIHDVDHPGVPNAQLVKDGDRLAALYDNKSVAEQNSIDLAWNVLMHEDYTDLQRAIFSTQAELDRFRKIAVNSVLATDLFDEELIAFRDARWQQAFNEEHRDESLSVEELENLRATVVVEHVLMASDIGHTMQHWYSFRRWNERLFFEMYDAYKNGRIERDPSQTWYQEEIKFFDSIVIPLAIRLQSSGVFGVAGDDAVKCAQSNRKEWVINGGDVVADLAKRYDQYKAGRIG